MYTQCRISVAFILFHKYDEVQCEYCIGVTFILAGPSSPKLDGPIDPPFKLDGQSCEIYLCKNIGRLG